MTGKNFRIRPIRESDVNEWFRLRKLLWEGSTDAEHKAEMLDIYEHRETQLVLVAEIENEKLVGFLEASIRPFVEDCHSERVGYRCRVRQGWRPVNAMSFVCTSASSGTSTRAP